MREAIRAKYGSRMKITAADQASWIRKSPPGIILRITDTVASGFVS